MAEKLSRIALLYNSISYMSRNLYGVSRYRSIMAEVTKTQEARTPTTLIVEETILAPMDKIVSKHMDIDMDAIRVNENSSTHYDFTLTDNLTGVKTDMVGIYTVGEKSSTSKPTLGLKMDSLLKAAHIANNPQVNAFLAQVVKAQVMVQDGATSEDIEAFYLENEMSSKTRNEETFKVFKDRFTVNTVRDYAAVVKIKPNA